jgi:hypothetical protein
MDQRSIRLHLPSALACVDIRHACLAVEPVINTVGLLDGLPPWDHCGPRFYQRPQLHHIGPACRPRLDFSNIRRPAAVGGVGKCAPWRTPEVRRYNSPY